MKTPKLFDGDKVSLSLGQVVEDPATSRGEPAARHIANPEAYFEGLKDLAGSMNDVGLLQPILVRQVEDGFLVVCGRRRLAAARYLGWDTIPAIVRVMTDEQAAVAELLENLQRADLDPLDEAAGYKRLAATGHTVAEIATMVHRSPSTVAGRLALLDLPGEALDAIRGGRLSMAAAAEIARLPGQAQREAAAARIISLAVEVWAEPEFYEPDDDEYDDGGSDDGPLRIEPLSANEARGIIRREFMTSLAAAPFDANDAELVPAAGSCAQCARRTGNALDLFGDLVAGPRGQDICTYVPCYQSKREAHVERALTAAREAGLAILPTTQAEKAFSTSGYLLHGKWVEADATARNPVTGNLLKQTWRKALGKKAPTEIAAVVPATGKVVSLYVRKAAEDVLREKYGKPEEAPTAAAGSGKKPKLSKHQEEHRARVERSRAATTAVLDLVVPADAEMDLVLDRLLELVRLACLLANDGNDFFTWTWEVLNLDTDDVEPYVAKVDAERGDVGLVRLFADGVLRDPLQRTFQGHRHEFVADRVERLIGRSFVEILADVDRQAEADAGGEG